MKNLQYGLFFAVLASMCACATGNHTGQQPPISQHVIIIGIDGMSSEGLVQATTPVMDNLIESGAFKYAARAVQPSSSMANWGAMVLGAGPEISGVTSNDWKPDGTFMKPAVSTGGVRFPGIFEVIRQQLPEAEQGAVFHWGDFGRLVDESVVNYRTSAANPEEAVELFTHYIIDKKPAFAFLQLDHVDGAGHEFGHMTPRYLDVIAYTDTLVGKMIDAVEKAGIMDQTLVMVVSDHGGIDKGHGGELDEEINVPVIYYGSGVKKGHRIQQPVYQYDVAATVAFALQIAPPYAWTGRPVKAAFEGFEEPVD